MARLADRAKKAAELAEAQRKADEAKRVQPVATVRLGRNPTFMRLQFDWNVDTEAKFAFRGAAGTLDFDWPVPIDLYDLKADLPKEFKGATNSVSAVGSRVRFTVADGVTPRFYQLTHASSSSISMSPRRGLEAALAAEEAQKGQAGSPRTRRPQGSPPRHSADVSTTTVPTRTRPAGRSCRRSPTGGTIRVTFPFDNDTAAAVFRRGDTVWMVFDTGQDISALRSQALSTIASSRGRCGR